MARGFVAVALAALVVAALPAGAARRARTPFPCEGCLFQVGLDGRNVRLVAKAAPADLSPDRRWMVFSDARQLVISQLDGTQRRVVAADGVDAPFTSFSPDGKKIVFVRREPQGSRCASSVWLVGADGSRLTRIADCAEGPAWAPESRRIAYIANVGDVTVLTLGGGRRVVDRVEDASPPVWSPRGDLLGYRALVEPAPANAIGGFAGGRAQYPPAELRVIRPDGRRVWRYLGALDVSWAPDGRTLAFEQDGHPFDDVPSSQEPLQWFVRIAMVHGKAGPPHRASIGPWSPDGRFMAWAGDHEVLVLPRVAGRDGRRVALADAAGYVQNVWWSQDGRRLLFSWRVAEEDEDVAPHRASSFSVRPTRDRLFDPRACSAAWGDWSELYDACATKTIPLAADVPEYDCSVGYHAARPTRLTLRMLYEGRVQRASTTTVDGWGHAGIGFRFAALESQHEVGLPAGSYACEFRLGAARARVAFRKPGSEDVIRVPDACSTVSTKEHSCAYYTASDASFPQTHSVTCSAIFAGRQEHSVEIRILRGESLLYAGKDRLRYPITSEWARTSARPGQFLAAGDYTCRFFLDGRVVAERPFTIKA